MLADVIFKRVGEGRPYPEHGLGPRDWAALPPRQVRLDELVTTKDTLQLAALLDEDSTFYGDLFAHVVEWRGGDYPHDGPHPAPRPPPPPPHPRPPPGRPPGGGGGGGGPPPGPSPRPA